jgi:hypothetical protein
VSGGSLDRYLAGTPQPPRVAAQFVETLARAVQHAHVSGVLHRDLKPANVLLALSHVPPAPEHQRADAAPLAGGSWLNEAVPKITDFGLAKHLNAGAAGPTRSGEVVGTPSYMAPEQAGAQHQQIGPATDIYGLGAILYELLTGRPPFKGETMMETLEQVRSVEPVSPSRLSPHCPRDLVTICLKCLQKEPAKRYTSAAALADDLRRFLESRPILARPVSVWGRAVKWARRQPAVAALLAGIVAVTLLGLAGISWKWREAEKSRAEAEKSRDEAKDRLYCERIARASQELAANHVTLANQLLDQCRQETPQLCHWEWDLLKRRCNEQVLELVGHTLDVRCVAYSPNGQLLASCSGEWNGDHPGEVLVWNAVSGERLHSFPGHKATVYWVAFHPDGRRLASAGRDKVVQLWDLDNPGGKPVELKQGDGVYCVAFSPDGQRLAAACADGHVRVTDLTTNRLLADWPLHKGPPPPMSSVWLTAPMGVTWPPRGETAGFIW